MFDYILNIVFIIFVTHTKN